MTVRKQSVAFDEQLLRDAKESATREGKSFSAWVNRAVYRELKIERGLAAVAEVTAEYGPPSALDIARADRVLDRALGVRGKRKPGRGRTRR